MAQQMIPRVFIVYCLSAPSPSPTSAPRRVRVMGRMWRRGALEPGFFEGRSPSGPWRAGSCSGRGSQIWLMTAAGQHTPLPSHAQLGSGSHCNIATNKPNITRGEIYKYTQLVKTLIVFYCPPSPRPTCGPWGVMIITPDTSITEILWLLPFTS